ncbi:uncharacterized protein LOC110980737 [Acanthaster planci]|uniref:Uncharacterized protein LOC110980737 n=1 Tax=Acanthaster planci TaxID=133434 RepID=A0A8B7YLP9_ACAPL|nr:uncharacterized protein LOC110980737 [Acanthaster planci]
MNYHGQRDMDLAVQLARDIGALEDASMNYVRSRRATIQLLRDLADYLQKHHHRAKIAKVVGGSVGVVASGLVIGGFVASFFTFGASLLVAGVGAGVGAAGGLTTVGGFLTEIITQKLTTTSAKKILEHDKIACDNLKAALERVESTWRSLRDAGRVVVGLASGGRQIFNVVDSIYDLVRVGAVAFQAGEVASQTAFKAASTVGRGMAVVGVAFSVIAIPLDLHTVITSSIAIHNRTVPEVARVILEKAKELAENCPSEEEMHAHVTRIRGALQHI